MKLDEYKKMILAQREATKKEALSALSAKMTKTKERKTK